MVKKYPLLFLFILGILGFGLYLVFPVENKRDILAPQGEGDRLLFGNKVVIGQEFIPHAGLSGIDIPLGSTSYPSSPLILHLRHLGSDDDVVSTPLFALENDIAQFRFSPLWKVPVKMRWILEAPHAAKDSLWVYREQDESAFGEGRMYENSRSVKGNVGFSEYWKYPRIANTRSHSEDLTLIDFDYRSLYIGIIGLILFLLVRRMKLPENVFVGASIILGIALHVWIGLHTPVIIDEGAYVQDVLQSSTDLLPFRDFLTKGPVYIFFLWIWSFIVPNTVIAWRLFSALSWALGGFLLWKLSAELGLKERSRVLTVASFSLFPAAVALSTPLLLQTTSVTVSLGGMLLAFLAVKKDSQKMAIWSAVVFTLAFLTRVTSAIPALVTLGVYLYYAKPRFKIRLASVYVASGLVCIALIFGLIVATIGLPKAAVMFNMEAFLISQNRQENVASVPVENPLIRTLTIESRLFWRGGVLFFTSILLLPLLFISKYRLVASSGILLLVYYVGKNVLAHLNDTSFLLPRSYLSTVWLIIILGFVLPLITALAVILHERQDVLKKRNIRPQALLLIFGWLVLTVFAYSKWGRFRQSYLTEFLPQLALLLGVAFNFMIKTWSRIKPVWFSRLLLGVFVVLVCAFMYQGYVMAVLYPHTGTVDQTSLLNITELLKKEVPADEMIFTAHPVATAFSDRQIMFGYAHPGWYRDARLGNISNELRALLFREPAEITEYLDTTTRFVFMDSRTNEIYFDGYPERSTILEHKFELVGSVNSKENGAEYTLYRRR